jgi:hypothetical protein
MHIKEKLPNGWLMLYYPEICHICEQEKLSGKVLFDKFVCTSCAESLGGID